MWALIALMALKEGYMGIMGLIFLKKGKMLDGAMWFGKSMYHRPLCGASRALSLPVSPRCRCQRTDSVYDGGYAYHTAAVYSRIPENALIALLQGGDFAC